MKQQCQVQHRFIYNKAIEDTMSEELIRERQEALKQEDFAAEAPYITDEMAEAPITKEFPEDRDEEYSQKYRSKHPLHNKFEGCQEIAEGLEPPFETSSPEFTSMNKRGTIN